MKLEKQKSSLSCKSGVGWGHHGGTSDEKTSLWSISFFLCQSLHRSTHFIPGVCLRVFAYVEALPFSVVLHCPFVSSTVLNGYGQHTRKHWAMPSSMLLFFFFHLPFLCWTLLCVLYVVHMHKGITSAVMLTWLLTWRSTHSFHVTTNKLVFALIKSDVNWLPWSDRISSGTPNQHTQKKPPTSTSATDSVSMFLSCTASGHHVTKSTHMNTYQWSLQEAGQMWPSQLTDK